MKQAKGKNLQDFAPLLRAHQGRVITVSDDDYRDLSRHISERCSTFIPGGGLVVGINPRFTHPHKIVQAARTVLGSGPETILSALGIEALVASVLCAHLSPWCTTCNTSARLLPERRLPELPREGVVALGLSARGAPEINLTEWCELLGVERARRDNRLVAVADLIQDDSGEPILRIFANQEYHVLTREVDRWFASGGGELVVYHLASRDAEMRELGRIRNTAVCESCGADVPLPTVATVRAMPECVRCGGKGWLETRSGRLEACGSCDGYGSDAVAANAQCAGVPLRHAGCLSFREVAQLLPGSSARYSLEDIKILELVSASVFGSYGIGMPRTLLSRWELVQLSDLSAQLSGLQGIRFLAEGGYSCSDPGCEEKKTDSVVCRIEPHWSPVRSSGDGAGSRKGEMRLLQVYKGFLALDSIAFPLGVASLVRASSDRAAELLVNEVAERFKIRRKLSATCSFGELKRCVSITGDVAGDPTVLELLGLAETVAEELARTQAAKRAGLTKADLVVGTTSRRCVECEGGGLLQDHPSQSCSVCRGTGLSAAVNALVFGRSTYGDIIASPLSAAKEALWMSDDVESILSSLIGQLPEEVAFASRSSQIGIEMSRFLQLFGALAALRVAGARGRKSESGLAQTLVVLREPFAITMQHQLIIFQLLDEVLRSGATILAAGVPRPLEKWFSNVVELRQVPRSADDAAQDRYLDSRFVRAMFTV